jgi:acyl-CoA thioesterase
MTQHEPPVATPEQVIQSANNAGYFQLLGVHLEIPQRGVGHVRTQVDKRLFHAQMIVHGGVIFTLADTAMSMAILSVLPPGMRISTIEAKINYLQPVRRGELLAEGLIVHQGRSTAVLESTVYNIIEDERIAIARVLGTFHIAPPKKAPLQ